MNEIVLFIRTSGSRYVKSVSAFFIGKEIAMSSIIRVKGLYKSFDHAKTSVAALQDINFEIEKGDIFGIIGMSGAGKSTLVRCLNCLEKPTAGTIEVNGMILN